MTTIDIDRDAAHDAAQNELGKPVYPRASATEQLTDWLNHLLYRIAEGGASVPGGWLTLTVLAILVVTAVVVTVRIALRAMRTGAGDSPPLLGTSELSAAEHRITADQYAANGNWPSAIRHRVRAVARHLEENRTLDPSPGRTATELARDAGAALPGLSGELTWAANSFNDVTYGDRPGDESAYRRIVDLDNRLRNTTATAAAVGAPGADGWAPVR